MVGNKKIIQDFTNAATLGKQFQIDDVLYVADGVMMIGSFKEIKK